MKKITLLVAFVAAVAFTSCDNKKAGTAGVNDSVTVVEGDSAAVAAATSALGAEAQATVSNLTGELTKNLDAKDSKGIIASLANLATIYKNLVESGKLEEAKGYGNAVKAFITQNAEKIKAFTGGNATIAKLVDGIQKLPTDAATTAEQAKNAVLGDITKLASPSIAKGATAIATAEAAAEAVKNAPAAVKDAANAAANAAVEKAKTAVQEKANAEVDKAKEKANAEVDKAAKKANDAVNAAKDKALKGLGL